MIKTYCITACVFVAGFLPAGSVYAFGITPPSLHVTVEELQTGVTKEVTILRAPTDPEEDVTFAITVSEESGSFISVPETVEISALSASLTFEIDMQAKEGVDTPIGTSATIFITPQGVESAEQGAASMQTVVGNAVVVTVTDIPEEAENTNASTTSDDADSANGEAQSVEEASRWWLVAFALILAVLLSAAGYYYTHLATMRKKSQDSDK